MQNIPFHWKIEVWRKYSGLFLTKFYLLPVQSIEIMTAAYLLTLSISACSQLFRKPLQLYSVTHHEDQMLFPSLSLGELWRGSGLSIELS